MKFYVHHNDLHELPMGQEIIARLGWAGYGRAHALLETLAKLVPNDGKCVFQLPLAKPTDIAFWGRKIQQSEQETEQTFDVFQDARLIAPWRDTQIVCAPMLGELVDEYNKRKRRAKKEVGTGDHDSQTGGGNPSHQLGPAPTDGEIMAEYRKAMLDSTGEALNATTPHQKDAITFFKKYGKDVAISAWVCFLKNSPRKVKLEGGKEVTRMWPLYDFIASGEAEHCAGELVI